MKKLITVLCLAASLFAYGKIFQSDDQFSITLPDDWIEIPKEVLDTYADNIAQLSPDTPSLSYEYGYQLGGARDWLTHPYILVQVKNVGRVPSGELSRYKKLKSGFEEGVEQIEEGLSEVVSDITTGEPVYDKENTMLWMSMSAGVQEAGTVKAVIGIKLTEKGMIQLNGYAKEDNFAEYDAIYTKAFAGLDVDESIKYRPQITDSAPVIGGINTGKVLAAGIKGAVIGGVFGLIALINKSVKKKKKADS